MGNNGSKTPQAVEKKAQQAKVQDTIDFSRLFKPKEQKVESHPVTETVKPKNKQEVTFTLLCLDVFICKQVRPGKVF